MDCHPEDAQIGRHQKDAASVASDQLQTHGSSERTGEKFLLIYCFLQTVSSPFVLWKLLSFLVIHQTRVMQFLAIGR
jgi:hypothetical protein